MAALADQLAAEELKVNDLFEENIRLQQELEAAIAGEGEPGQVDVMADELAAKQAEIDSLSAELGAGYEELGRLQESNLGDGIIVSYVFVLEHMQAFAQSGFTEPLMYVEDSAFEDALLQIDDPGFSDDVVVGILEASPANTEPFYAAFQQVLNHMQEALIT